MAIDSDELTRLYLKFIDSAGVDDSEKEEIKNIIEGKDSIKLPESMTREDSEAPSEREKPKLKNRSDQEEEKSKDLRFQISEMRVCDKVKLAMFGNKECRGILIFDKNRLIQEFVLKNPMLQISEIEEFVKNPTMPEDVLRNIGKNKDWMKTYSMKKSLVTNPKCPLALSMHWLKYLQLNDLKTISKSKNLPQVLSTAAKKKVAEAQKKTH